MSTARCAPGNTSIACSATIEGAIRYDSAGNVQQFCDGSNWINIGAFTGAATGQSMVAGWPDAIVCNVTNPASLGTALFYAVHLPHGATGNYIYRHPDANNFYHVVFNPDGSFSNYAAITTANCNASIASLTASGQTFNFANGAVGTAADMSDGTAGAPGLYFTSDVNTGFYRPGADIMAVATGGTEKLRVDSTGKTGIGTITPATTLDVNGEIRPGNTAIACSAATEGAIRYNSSGYHEFCDGTNWRQFVGVQSATPPTAPAGAGYFVMTNTTWDGNLGGRSGADSKCLTELATTYANNWNGYTDANNRGLLNSTNVKAWLCEDAGPCTELMPLTTYYFATAGNPSAGGASFTTDASAVGPQDNGIWSAANYFSGTYDYWVGRAPGSSTLWGAQHAVLLIRVPVVSGYLHHLDTLEDPETQGIREQPGGTLPLLLVTSLFILSAS